MSVPRTKFFAVFSVLHNPGAACTGSPGLRMRPTFSSGLIARQWFRLFIQAAWAI